MARQEPNLVESATWKAMEDFSEGIDTNRLPQTGALDSTHHRIVTDDGLVLNLEFREGHRVDWNVSSDWLVASGEDDYDGVELADGAFWVDISPRSLISQSLTAVFHPRKGWALLVHSVINPEGAETETRVTQTFHAGYLNDHEGATRPAPTRDLIGKRTLFRYSANHLYEHIYLSSRRFVWHNLVGEQRGHAAAELATTYKLDEGVYLFTWREEVIPVGTVFIFDYARGRSTGKFIGLSSAGQIQNDPGGAEIIEFGYSDYSAHQEPV